MTTFIHDYRLLHPRSPIQTLHDGLPLTLKYIIISFHRCQRMAGSKGSLITVKLLWQHNAITIQKSANQLHPIDKVQLAPCILMLHEVPPQALPPCPRIHQFQNIIHHDRLPINLVQHLIGNRLLLRHIDSKVLIQPDLHFALLIHADHGVLYQDDPAGFVQLLEAFQGAIDHVQGLKAGEAVHRGQALWDPLGHHFVVVPARAAEFVLSSF